MLQRLATATLFFVLILFVSLLGTNEASAGPSPPDTFSTSNVTRTGFTVSWVGWRGALDGKLKVMASDTD